MSVERTGYHKPYPDKPAMPDLTEYQVTLNFDPDGREIWMYGTEAAHKARAVKYALTEFERSYPDHIAEIVSIRVQETPHYGAGL